MRTARKSMIITEVGWFSRARHCKTLHIKKT